MSSEAAAQAVVHLDIRPVRAGYLVRAGSVRDVRLAILEASTRWGGITEPILEVTRSGRLRSAAAQLITILKPDLLISVGVSPEYQRQLQHATGVHSYALSHLRDRFLGAHQLASFDRGEVRSIQVALPPDNSLIHLAAMGTIPDEALGDWRRLGAAVRTAPTDDQVGRAQMSDETVVSTTGHGYGVVHATGPFDGPMIVWVSAGGRRQIRDVIDFWNCRALGWGLPSRRPALLIRPEVEPWVGFGDQLRAHLGGSSRSEPDVVLCSQTVSEDRLRQIRRALNLKEWKGTQVKATVYGGEAKPPERLFSAAINLNPFGWLGHERSYGRRSRELVQMHRPVTTLRLASPLRFHPQVSGYVQARFSGVPDFDVPQLPAVAKLFHDNAVWGGGGLELRTRPYAFYQFDFRLPEPVEVLRAALGTAGVQFELSDKGRLGQAVLGKVQDPASFANLEVVGVIKALTTPRREHFLAEMKRAASGFDPDALEKFAAEWGSRAQRTWRAAAELVGPWVKGPALGSVAEALVGAGLAERGFRLKCEDCLVESFVLLGEATGACPACGAAASYTAGKHGEPVVHYRLNGLVDRASDNGVIPHLWAIARLRSKYPRLFVLPGADLFKGGNKLGELDLVGYTGANLLAGEVKSRARDFTEVQVRRDLRLAAVIGSSLYVAACLEPFDEGQREFLKNQARAKGLEALLLDPSGKVVG